MPPNPTTNPWPQKQRALPTWTTTPGHPRPPASAKGPAPGHVAKAKRSCGARVAEVRFAVPSLRTVDHVQENRKARYLDWLYDQSSRTSEVYTGLYQERIKQLIDRDMEEALDD